MVSFLKLAAEKKALSLVHPKQIFGPSYFVKTKVSVLEEAPHHSWLSFWALVDL